MSGNDQISKYSCQNVECNCVSGRYLCDPNGTDLTEWFTSEDGPKGPSTMECIEPVKKGDTRKCTFSGTL
jgi:hypothetical protein